MFKGLRLLIATVAGIVLGLAATYAAVVKGLDFSASSAGPWIVPSSDGEPDPYMAASLVKRNEVPLGLGEGMSLIAETDSADQPLNGRCDYLIYGVMPAARYWTLSVMTPQGRLIANPAERYGFTSSELLRSANGSFVIEASRHARPGNWLPLSETVPRFVFNLRLYDSPVVASAATFSAEDLPTIKRKECQ